MLYLFIYMSLYRDAVVTLQLKVQASVATSNKEYSEPEVCNYMQYIHCEAYKIAPFLLVQ